MKTAMMKKEEVYTNKKETYQIKEKGNHQAS